MTPARNRDPASKMRAAWDERARENAIWYVDTSLSYDQPNLDRFWHTGRVIVQQVLLESGVSPEHHGVALEIGSGLGRICRALAPHFERVIGVDVSPEMVARARSLVDEANVEFRLGDGQSLDVPDSSVDFVTSFTVLQHLLTRRLVTAYVEDAMRVLRRGGVMAVQWNNQPPVRYRLRTWRFRALARLGRVRHHTADRTFTGVSVPRSVLHAAVEQAGGEVVRTSGEGTLFAFLWARKS